MHTAWIIATLLLIVSFAVIRWLRGAAHDVFDVLDVSHVQRFAGSDPSAPGQQKIAAILAGAAPLIALPLREQIPALRSFMNAMFAQRPFTAQFHPVDVDGVRGEWVLAPGADPRRRTLYIHGGAFTMGSPLSHRPLTENFSRLTGGAVFAVDYRLMPENRRAAGITDCRNAYRWLLDNGPDGPMSLDTLFVAGDSAGGNLTLSVIAWARDSGLRAANAAVALSPFTDAAFGSPSLKDNLETDPMLGPMFTWLRRLPGFLKPVVGAVMSQGRPSDAAISPLHGDLAKLPPVLVQASECEMLLDDGRRYVAKAVAAGSPARLQTWSNMPHVWQMFDQSLSEAGEALAQIEHFVNAVAPAAPRAVS